MVITYSNSATIRCSIVGLPGSVTAECCIAGNSMVGVIGHVINGPQARITVSCCTDWTATTIYKSTGATATEIVVTQITQSATGDIRWVIDRNVISPLINTDTICIIVIVGIIDQKRVIHTIGITARTIIDTDKGTTGKKIILNSNLTVTATTNDHTTWIIVECIVPDIDWTIRAAQCDSCITVEDQIIEYLQGWIGLAGIKSRLSQFNGCHIICEHTVRDRHIGCR